MKNKKIARHRGSVLSNIFISGAVTCIAEVILILNVSLMDQLLISIGYRGTLSEVTQNYLVMLVLLYVVIGIVIFACFFAFLQYRNIRYMHRISAALEDVADGNFERRIAVVGDDELSDMALNLNHMAEEICALMEKEHEAEQTKNDLITNVAHDLRTPLTSIIGYMDLIIKNPLLEEETRQKYLQIAYEKSKHLQKLIEDLFGFTKLNYGKLTAELKPLDIVCLLEQLLDEFYPVFEHNGMEYEYHASVPSQEIMGDGTLLARLFDNLINNAIKYGKEGKQLIVNLNVKNERVVIDVINYGHVISKKDLQQIFDKFYRAEQSRSKETGGTGLGLAIAKNIAELHGGTISADSSLNGTVFEVTIPVLKEAAAVAPQEAGTEGTAENGAGTAVKSDAEAATEVVTEAKGPEKGGEAEHE